MRNKYIHKERIKVQNRPANLAADLYLDEDEEEVLNKTFLDNAEDLDIVMSM